MIDVKSVSPESLKDKFQHFWALSGEKIIAIEDGYDSTLGAPVFTRNGLYSSRGWTEWTQGFQYGSAILQFDATGDAQFLEIGRRNTVDRMAPHLVHTGVHDHGFNNISTYGNLLRLAREGRIESESWQQEFYKLALKVSSAIQAARWTEIRNGGYIYSFNGPHSLFIDTIRSCRILGVGHKLGHYLPGENDARIDLLERMLTHIETSAKYSIFYGEGRDAFDVPGRTAHEVIFNVNDGNYRCPNSQQGYSGFTTWTRGLAWAILGFAEQLEFLATFKDEELSAFGGKGKLEAMLLKAAEATSNFYIENSPTDGIPYWDTGAPNLHRLGDYLERASDPYNAWEPVDSSAAAIAAQGLLRLGRYLKSKGMEKAGTRFWQAGLTVVEALLRPPYLSTESGHQGLILHAIYHQPNGWDYVPQGSKIANGEACMWGDYHAREVVLYLQRLLNDEKYYTFYSGVEGE
ncbi:MAG: glycosyl hydrolase [Calditrichaeota bacterium]|nr:MAG: glycosyl hydrolase [Calditrichota bacterium]